MKIVVLLSAGVHPISRRPVLPGVERQAIRMALDLGGDVVGLHAGPDGGPIGAALGHGLSRLDHRVIAAGDDPLPSLVAALREHAPDLILAGHCAQGGDESGLVPYVLAKELGVEIVADAAALAIEGRALSVDQALPRGVRRRIRATPPAVVTVHPAALPARPYAFAAERRGVIETRPGIAAPSEADSIEERPARPRPKLIGGGSGSAADRLKAATEAAKGGGEKLVDPTPEDAARAILAHLRKIGALAG